MTTLHLKEQGDWWTRHHSQSLRRHEWHNSEDELAFRERVKCSKNIARHYPMDIAIRNHAPGTCFIAMKTSKAETPVLRRRRKSLTGLEDTRLERSGKNEYALYEHTLLRTRGVPLVQENVKVDRNSTATASGVSLNDLTQQCTTTTTREYEQCTSDTPTAIRPWLVRTSTIEAFIMKLEHRIRKLVRHGDWNQANMILGLFLFALACLALQYASTANKIADRSLRLELWRDCQDRSVVKLSRTCAKLSGVDFDSLRIRSTLASSMAPARRLT